jgi:hypothetical protein
MAPPPGGAIFIRRREPLKQGMGRNSIGGVPVVFWWCSGGVLVVLWWCFGGVEKSAAFEMQSPGPSRRLPV